MGWYLGVWKNFAVFSGRARRREYWMFVLFHFLVLLAGQAVMGAGVAMEIPPLLNAGFLFVVVYFLAGMIPYWAVTIRRLHDTGKSGWMILVNLIPFIGGLIMFIFMIDRSEPRPNRYGPCPE